jgi:membrane-bound lytic murein transglycosylase B
MKKHILCLFLFLGFSVAASGAQGFADRADVGEFVAAMHERHGFSRSALTALFRKTKPLPGVIKAVTPPTTPSAKSWHAFHDRFVEPKHIANGLDFWRDNAEALAAAKARYGVPEEILVGILGVETMYGRRAGRIGTFAALATLAFDYPPRAELFRRELEQFLLLAREEKRDPLSYRGSFAGAIGMPQFLPGTARAYAVDFDDSGDIDLSGSPADAVGSIANFLKQRGWVDGGPVALPATVVGERYRELLAEGILPKRKPSEMAEFGVTAEAAPEEPAALIDLPTADEAPEFRLGFGNFYVLTRYNRSSAYAAAVFDLAQALVAARQTAAAYSSASRPTPSR